MENMDHISKTQFKAHALEVFRDIEKTGKPLIITDHGKPTLVIKKFQNSKPHPLEILRGSVIRFDNPTQPVADDDWENA